MSNVVSINGGKEIDILNGVAVTIPKTRTEYLFLCKEFLTIDDYEDVLCCILDQEFFDKTEKQIQEIVKTYFSFDF